MSQDPLNVVIQGVIPVPKPGEVVVARLDERTPSQGVDHVRDKLRKMFPANRIMLLCGDSDVSLQPKELAPAEKSVIQAIDYLQRREGDGLAILNDPNHCVGYDDTAVCDVVGEWCGEEGMRFRGASWQEAVKAAADARKNFEAKLPGDAT